MARVSESAHMEVGRTNYSVGDFLGWQRNNTLRLSPSFQRRSVWRKGEKSYFIDSVARGVPIPIIFIRERTDIDVRQTIREVVDGQQRLRTLISFIEPQLLPDLNPDRDIFTVRESDNAQMANKKFEKLPRDIQQRILHYKFSVDVLPPDLDDAKVLDIFVRINCTGRTLADQEVRHAQYYAGVLAQTAATLAFEQLGRWRKWRVFTEQSIARMSEVELTSEFILLMYQGLSGKTKPSLDDLYKDNLDKMPKRGEVTRRFRKVMDVLDDCLGADLAKLEFRKLAWFYPVFALVYDLLYDLKSPLKRKRPRTLRRTIRGRLLRAEQLIKSNELPDKVSRSVERRTTHLVSRKPLFEYLKDVCSAR